MPARIYFLSLAFASFIITTTPLSYATSAPMCAQIFAPSWPAQLVKTRKSGARIFKIQNYEGKTAYYKESLETPSFEDAVFNNDQMAQIVFNFFQSFGLEKYVAQSTFEKEGMDLLVGGVTIHVKPGILQEAQENIQTPLDGYKIKYKQEPTSSAEIQKILNEDKWPEHYANWKLIWILLGQVDLNIANLGISEGDLFVFDLGDSFNVNSSRETFGVKTDYDNFDINFPDHPNDRVRHIPDFRKASDDLKQMIRKISVLPVADLENRLGARPQIQSLLKTPRSSIHETALALQKRAQFLLPYLDRAPF